MSLREDILNIVDIKEELVEIPEWKKTVLVRGLTAEQKATLNGDLMPNPDTKRIDYKRMYGELIVMGVLEPDTKKPVFEPADIQTLLQKNAGVIENLAMCVLAMSGLMPGQQAEALKN
jgi:hypothetical protein